MIEDFEIIRRVRSGQQELFALLIKKHQGDVFGLCCSLLSDQTEAQDAAQEIFLKAYRAFGSFREDSSFATWLYRIGVNHCRDLLRAKSRRKTESLDHLMERHAQKIERLLSDSVANARSAEDAELIERLLSALPEDYRIILTLREAQGLSYQEIAETLDCSLDAVKARLRRARQALLKARDTF
ncbi:MAG: sigma-70 family RNA polymerase sigma factor [Elusimicrobia bacterium]|nr:sigma-70 family RNA polymerase sigma factor [Elusimicrobiota bacterium]